MDTAPSHPTPDDLLARWRKAKGRARSEDTVETLLADVNWLLATLATQHDIAPDDLNSTHLDAQSLATAFSNLETTASTDVWVRRYLSVRTWLEWANSRSLLPSSSPPLRKVQPPTEAADRWVALLIEEYITGLDKSERTRQAYREDLLNVSDVIATSRGTTLLELTLDELDTRTVEQGFALWRSTGGRNSPDGKRSKNSRARAHAAWSSWFRWLIARDLAPRNPMEQIDKPKMSAQDPKRLQTIDPDGDVVTAILNAATTPGDTTRKSNIWPERDLAAITILMFCGLRRAEVCSLDVGSFMQGRDELPRLAVHGKGDKPRIVPMDPRMSPILNDYLTDRKRRFDLDTLADNAPLIVDRHNTRMTNSQLAYLVDQIITRSGVKKPEHSLVHAFRHSYAIQMVRDGVPVNQLKDLLGHSQLTTTQRYIQASGEELYDAQRLHSGLPALEQAGRKLADNHNDDDN